MGGGVLRTAAKVASGGSFRSPLAGEASRRVARPPASSFLPAVEPGISVSSLSAGPAVNETPAITVAARWPEWEFDEWDFAADEEKQILESVDVAPRLVFGPVPTIEEAKEATTDLKEALEKVYFTPEHTPGSCEGGQATSGAVSAVPKHVSQMFSLLQGSSEAQGVVASLASDENVWNAVMKNEKVQQFCMNASPAVTQIFTDPAESVASKSGFSTTMESGKTSQDSFVMDLLNNINNIKVKVTQVMSNISDYLQDIFGISSEKETSSSDDKHTNKALGASFLALAVASILIVLLKRA
ncbi:uncharacterized protein LOC110039597 [Phalaenopsis equestris]|uniref:uncharacterized protein LOC110039597 n=1 Tax=Phalaenopsis equestris TaxID=78828 RepID=UPI0009E22BFA|nr:uncharacterized protein LOC110039597 [Phalaenopsis equestris]